MDNVFSFGASDVLHETLGGTAEGLIGNAIEKVLEKAFEGAGGGIASLFTIAADIALSISEKEKEAEKRRIELEANHDNMSVALFINTFGMKGVIVTDENNKMMLLCYPTGTTERRIKALNEALEKKGYWVD